LPLYFEDDQRIFVHAGVVHDTPVHDTDDMFLQWGLYSDRYETSRRLADEPHCSGKHVVHGHHQSADHPLLLPHRTNLDSFAWHTGRLAIGVFDDDVPGGPTEILWAALNA
jgi:serine/threonine protein phosphatase 1